MIRHAAGQKAEELRSATQSKAQELKGTAESWQAEGHAYIRENPTKSVLIALGLGVLLGLLFRKMTHGSRFFAWNSRIRRFGRFAEYIRPMFL